MRPMERKSLRVDMMLLLFATLLWPGQPAFAQFTEQFKAVGSGSAFTSHQGSSVAVSGNGTTFIVGGPGDNGSVGATWVFTRSGGQQGNKLIGSGAVGAANQGQSVALSADGNTAIVGGPQDNGSAGAVWVFTRSGGVWSQQDKLTGTNPVGTARQGTSARSEERRVGNERIGGWSDNHNDDAERVF